MSARLNNGFWLNNFVTSALWWDTNNTAPDQVYPRNKPADPYVGSYLMNAVTPVQRRTRSPEYQMEICRKIPVSLCGPKDWTVTGAGTTGNISAIPTDTLRYVAPADQRFPRRVAFDREPTFNLLRLASNANRTPRPIGINGTTPQPYQYGAAATPPATANNALWFMTTTGNNADPANPAIVPSEANNRLPYYQVDPEVPDLTHPAVFEKQLLLPGTPEFPAALNIPSLNGQTAADPSDFAVCTPSFNSIDQYQVTPTAGACAATPTVELTRAALATLVPATTPPAPPADGSVPLIARAKVNVFQIPLTGITPNATLTLDNTQNLVDNSGNQIDPIFVIQGPATGDIAFNTVTLALNGVNPNNVFWVSNAGVTFTGNNTLAGNFLGATSGNLTIPAGTQILGGRFLGFGGTVAISTTFNAMTASEPLLVPMLQIYNPEGISGGYLGIVDRDWLQRVPVGQRYTYNAAFVTGDTPSRPDVLGGTAETSGGLNNFVRFLESWGVDEANRSTAKIDGSFIQAKRSAYATAPYQAADPAQDTLFFNGTAPNVKPPYLANDPNANVAGYVYRGGAERYRVPFFRPPTREWGFDVGLLSQSPDVFSERFSSPSTGTPAEYFREVGRDDAWVTSLLCAAEGSGTTYQYAIEPSATAPQQRPQSCPTLATYND